MNKLWLEVKLNSKLKNASGEKKRKMTLVIEVSFNIKYKGGKWKKKQPTYGIEPLDLKLWSFFLQSIMDKNGYCSITGSWIYFDSKQNN